MNEQFSIFPRVINKIEGEEINRPMRGRLTMSEWEKLNKNSDEKRKNRYKVERIEPITTYCSCTDKKSEILKDINVYNSGKDIIDPRDDTDFNFANLLSKELVKSKRKSNNSLNQISNGRVSNANSFRYSEIIRKIDFQQDNPECSRHSQDNEQVKGINPSKIKTDKYRSNITKNCRRSTPEITTKVHNLRNKSKKRHNSNSISENHVKRKKCADRKSDSNKIHENNQSHNKPNISPDTKVDPKLDTDIEYPNNSEIVNDSINNVEHPITSNIINQNQTLCYQPSNNCNNTSGDITNNLIEYNTNVCDIPTSTMGQDKRNLINNNIENNGNMETYYYDCNHQYIDTGDYKCNNNNWSNSGNISTYCTNEQQNVGNIYNSISDGAYSTNYGNNVYSNDMNITNQYNPGIPMIQTICESGNMMVTNDNLIDAPIKNTRSVNQSGVIPVCASCMSKQSQDVFNYNLTNKVPNIPDANKLNIIDNQSGNMNICSACESKLSTLGFNNRQASNFSQNVFNNFNNPGIQVDNQMDVMTNPTVLSCNMRAVTNVGQLDYVQNSGCTNINVTNTPVTGNTMMNVNNPQGNVKGSNYKSNEVYSNCLDDRRISNIIPVSYPQNCTDFNTNPMINSTFKNSICTSQIPKTAPIKQNACSIVDNQAENIKSKGLDCIKEIDSEPNFKESGACNQNGFQQYNPNSSSYVNQKQCPKIINNDVNNQDSKSLKCIEDVRSQPSNPSSNNQSSFQQCSQKMSNQSETISKGQEISENVRSNASSGKPWESLMSVKRYKCQNIDDKSELDFRSKYVEKVKSNASNPKSSCSCVQPNTKSSEYQLKSRKCIERIRKIANKANVCQNSKMLNQIDTKISEILRCISYNDNIVSSGNLPNRSSVQMKQPITCETTSSKFSNVENKLSNKSPRTPVYSKRPSSSSKDIIKYCSRLSNNFDKKNSQLPGVPSFYSNKSVQFDLNSDKDNKLVDNFNDNQNIGVQCNIPCLNKSTSVNNMAANRRQSTENEKNCNSASSTANPINSVKQNIFSINSRTSSITRRQKNILAYNLNDNPGCSTTENNATTNKTTNAEMKDRKSCVVKVEDQKKSNTKECVELPTTATFQEQVRRMADCMRNRMLQQMKNQTGVMLDDQEEVFALNEMKLEVVQAPVNDFMSLEDCDGCMIQIDDTICEEDEEDSSITDNNQTDDNPCRANEENQEMMDRSCNSEQGHTVGNSKKAKTSGFYGCMELLPPEDMEDENMCDD